MAIYRYSHTQKFEPSDKGNHGRQILVHFFECVFLSYVTSPPLLSILCRIRLPKWSEFTFETWNSGSQEDYERCDSLYPGIVKVRLLPYPQNWSREGGFWATPEGTIQVVRVTASSFGTETVLHTSGPGSTEVSWVPGDTQFPFAWTTWRCWVALDLDIENAHQVIWRPFYCSYMCHVFCIGLLSFFLHMNSSVLSTARHSYNSLFRGALVGL